MSTQDKGRQRGDLSNVKQPHAVAGRISVGLISTDDLNRLKVSITVLRHSEKPQYSAVLNTSTNISSVLRHLTSPIASPSARRVYRSIDELQADLDSRIMEYNEARPHQGRWCFHILRAFVDDTVLQQVSAALKKHHYRTHEFGDFMLIEGRFRC
jgi:hypothetical protein